MGYWVWLAKSLVLWPSFLSYVRILVCAAPVNGVLWEFQVEGPVQTGSGHWIRLE